MTDRKPFGQAIEGEPLELRRLNEDEAIKLEAPYGAVGIFRISFNKAKNGKFLGFIDFDNIYDPQGNRFYND
jgi:hypothetical protein